jgi:hypothetical protein
VQTSANSSINSSATDVAATGFTTVLRRNQAQTHQIEVRITGNTTLTLGFDQGTDLTSPTTGGIPNSWWSQYFPDAADWVAANDADKDGLGNLQEYAFGSIPNDATSAARPMASPTANGFKLTFPTVTGCTYRVLSRESLSSGAWAAVPAANLAQGETNPVTGETGTTKSVTDSKAGEAGARFYRVEVSVP